MKAVFFTGATGGLGESCVRELAQRGWTVFAAGTNEGKLRELAVNPNIIPIRMDVADLDSIKAAHEVVLSRTDRLDALVNFAGLTAFTSMVEGEAIAMTERLLDVNVMGPVRVNYVFFDMIEKGHGRIVNCSSSAGWMKAQPFAGPYVLSKWALEGYNDSLRRELMYLDIPVIKIQPGSFRTKISGVVMEGFDRALAGTKRYRYVLNKMKPLMDAILRRSGDPQKLAMVVVKALEAKRPRLQYRKASGLLSLLEILPERGVDGVYKLFGKKRRKNG